MGSDYIVALAKNIVVLTGGVGGAKLASGLLQVVPPERLTFIVNTGDDFWSLGLRICPDLDTLMYTLSGLVDPAAGWGIESDTVVTLQSLERYYGIEPWFRLGDKDLATHLLRTHLLRQGYTPTEVAACLTERLGIRARILPMTDAEIPTIVDTVDLGAIGFQEYFVKYRWQPVIRSIRHKDCELATLSASVHDALEAADIVMIAPSNPWLSLAPILAVPGMRALLETMTAPVVAVTPIIAGAAVKGPTAKIMAELGIEISAKSVANFYHGLISGFVDDLRNETFQVDGLNMAQFDTLMTDMPAKIGLARAALEWIESWAT